MFPALFFMASTVATLVSQFRFHVIDPDRSVCGQQANRSARPSGLNDLFNCRIIFPQALFLSLKPRRIDQFMYSYFY